MSSVPRNLKTVMGDMSDLPNLHRTWIKRLCVTRLIAVAIGIIIAAAVFGFSAENQPNISITIKPSAAPAMTGAPYTLEAVIKNDNEKTVDAQIQVAMYALESACMEKGKRISFSNPVSLKVSPNGMATAILNFDSVSATCEMPAGVQIFFDGKMDRDRFSIQQDGNISIRIL